MDLYRGTGVGLKMVFLTPVGHFFCLYALYHDFRSFLVPIRPASVLGGNPAHDIVNEAFLFYDIIKIKAGYGRRLENEKRAHSMRV